MIWRKTITFLILTILILLAACSAESPEETVGLATAAPTAAQTESSATPAPTAIPTLTPSPTQTPPAAAVAAKSTHSLRYLEAAIEETVSGFDGFSSYVIVDLMSGERIARNEEVALAGMSLVKVPILINTYRVLNQPPDIEQTKLISETTALSSNFAANLLLQTIAGAPDAYAGADIVTQSMRDLGIYNTFIAVPIDADPRTDRLNTMLTPANQRTDITTFADPFRQTTTGDLAALMEMIYECALADSGALREKYAEQITAEECQEMLEKMQLNELARLLENGLPDDVPFAHKVGWIDDTHGDGGVVFSPGGDYIIVMALYAPSWLEWEDSAPLFETVSRQAYAHFNDADAYDGVVLPPLPSPVPITPTPDLPHAIVTGTQGIGLTIRETPGGKEVVILPEGSVLTMLDAAPVEHNGFQWHSVLTPGGETGWAADAFFTRWNE